MSQSRILVAVSSPWASQKLTDPIIDLSRRLDARVLIAHVSQHNSEDETETEAKQRGEQTLNVLTEALKQADVETDSLMLFSDDVARAILKTAQSHQCTLIVLGLTGKTRWRRLVTGNVPDDILKQSDIPVLLCPQNWSGKI